MTSHEAVHATLDAYTPSLLGNPNVAYAAVVARGEEAIIEVGVYSLLVNEQARARVGLREEGGPVPVPTRLLVPRSAKTGSDRREADYVDVVVVESGRIVAQYKDHHRPAEGGDSIGNINENSAGTMGAAVTISTLPQRVFIITNWHVLVGGFGSVGDIVLQPGRLDGGLGPADWVANVKWSALTSRVDLAIAEVRAPYPTYVSLGTIRGQGRIAGANYSPTLGSRAWKCGRTTDNTDGTIRSTHASVNVNGYPAGTLTFTNQILLTSMSRPGDSGSIVVDDNRKAIGLLFAGDSRTSTIANRWEDVERALSGAHGFDDFGGTSIQFE